VPEIEEREAAIFAGYTWRTWHELPREERTDGVAHYRLHRLISLHQDDAVAKDAERRMKRGTKGGS